MAASHILIVDDEPGVRSALVGILEDEGFAVEAVASGEEGLAALGRDDYDAVLLDVWLPGIDGIETLRRLRDERRDAEVIMISGHGTIETAVRATKLGAFDFVEKPLSLEKTLLVLRNALRQRGLERHNRRLLAQLVRDTEIIGHSEAAEALRRQVDVAAACEAPVLLVGERGTGRETVARRIHLASARAEGPFVEVPCGALEVTAADVALWGDVGRPGRFDLAAGGSLFLEEVNCLDPELQLRLARAIESQADDPGRPRIIASTGAEPGDLDPSLGTQIDVVRIEVPPLRARREDVPLLLERFLRELAREYGRESKRLSPEALSALKQHGWPGNVRELRNLVERLLLFAERETIDRRDLPQDIGGSRRTAEDLYREFGSLAEGVEAFERYYIARVLSEEGADRTTAARRLGLTAEELSRRLRSLF